MGVQIEYLLGHNKAPQGTLSGLCLGCTAYAPCRPPTRQAPPLQPHQSAAVLCEPRLAGLVVGHSPLDCEPELGRVVGLDEVGQLMDHDVLHDARGQENRGPMEEPKTPLLPQDPQRNPRSRTLTPFGSTPTLDVHLCTFRRIQGRACSV